MKKQPRQWMLGVGALAGLAVAAAASAQTTTTLTLDGSLPHGRTDDLTASQPGPSYVVGEDLGWRSGANLFHSFLEFDIGITTGVPDTVTFTADAAQPAVANVITRVTGGATSNIDGNLVVDPATLGTANFYFLNPHGVIFGSSSSVSVPKSLYVSTAHRLDFASDGGSLDLLDAAAPVLSVEVPVAFGFTDTGPREGVEIANAFAGFRPRIFDVPDGETLSIVAGDVDVTGTFLTARGGRVQLVAAGEAALTVPLDAAELHVAAGDAGLGGIEVDTFSGIRTLPFDTDEPQGTIVIRGGRFTLRDRTLAEAGDAVGGSGASIDVETSESVVLEDRSELRAVRQGDRTTGGLDVSTAELRVSDRSTLRSRVLSFAPAGAEGGAIAIDADSVAIEAGSSVLSLNESGGDGGDVTIASGALTLSDSELSLTAIGGGAAGDLDLDVSGGRVSIVEGGVVATQVSGDRPGGHIEITAETLEIVGGETQESAIETATLGSAPGGSIDLVVGTLRLAAAVAGGEAGRLAAAVGADAVGRGGSIDVTAASVIVADGAQISTTTQSMAPGARAAGAIRIDADDSVVLTGSRVGAQGLQRSGVFARSEGAGEAGDVRIEAPAIDVLGGAAVSSRGDGQLPGAGGSGNIDLVASESIRIVGALNPSIVTARGTVGAPGVVNLVGPEVAGMPGAVGRVELLAGSVIDVVNGSASNGGRIFVKADSLSIAGASGGGIPIASGLRAETLGLGDAGGVRVEVTGDAEISDGGLVSSITSGAGGAAGAIEITARQILMSGGSGSALSESGESAAAGDISFEAEQRIQLTNGAELLVRSKQGQDAGAITLSAPVVELVDSSLEADSAAFGGTVEIRAPELLYLERARIVALSRGVLAAPVALAAVAGASPLPAGGNVTISGGSVVVNRSQIVADGFGNANGGFIDILADPWLRSGDSQVTASSQFGVQGIVQVNTPYGEVTGDLATLPENFLDASSLLEEPCLARDAPSGSFSVRTVGRVLAPPDAPLSPQPSEPQECSAP